MPRHYLALLLFITTSASVAQTVTLDDLMGDEDPRLLLTLGEAVAQVREESGGEVLSAKTIRRSGVLIHRIIVSTPDNKEITYDIEAGDVQ